MADFIKVAELSALAEGDLLRVEVGDDVVCLAKVEDTVCAFTNDCTHRSGPLNEGVLNGHVLTCPWHKAQFDVRTGEVLQGPARQNIVTYPVKIEDGSILVRLPEE